jgi:hypothetical protein
MNWLFKLLGYRDRRYRGKDFSLRIEPIMREVVSVIYIRNGTTFNFGGERIKSSAEGIHVLIPQEVEATYLPQIVRDITSALKTMGYGYVIDRNVGVDVVPETERHAAMAELRKMGYEIEILPDQRIRQTQKAGAPRQDVETLRRQAPRMMALIQTVHGKRPRFEILAKSQGF